jgi:hypothetical protein
MTNEPSFRSCRPFSLLLSSSATFINVSGSYLISLFSIGSCHNRRNVTTH